MDQLHLGEPGGAWFFGWNVEEGWTKNNETYKNMIQISGQVSPTYIKTPATRARNPSFLGFFPLGCPFLQSDFLTAHLWRAWGLQGEPGRHCWSSTMDGDRITIPRKIQVVIWQSGLVFEELVKLCRNLAIDLVVVFEKNSDTLQAQRGPCLWKCERTDWKLWFRVTHCK